MPRNMPFGVCSVWHRSRHSEQAIPHIICPVRFRVPQVFRDAATALGRKGKIAILDEVQLKGIGRIDYLITSYTERPYTVLDFCALEVMAVSTTGTGGVIQGFLDALSGRYNPPYQFGINYRQVLSRMVVQLLAKGAVFSKWSKRTVWVVQDVFFDYMQAEYELDLPIMARPLEPMNFAIYTLTPGDGNPDRLALRLREFRGGTLEKFTGLLTTIKSPGLPEVEQLLLARIEAGQVVRLD